ncbi:hypothetical protein LAZ67_16000414 [Cordylochernes scorpioides]|uniref:Transposase n=1 Tax=Cordylochernes scorpioides TaxID=51811 RepID=A0ABY6LBF8_9ARAC|nr:hypothetical protein LAZ67_16000414 [Cordylochernes scorpioides]
MARLVGEALKDLIGGCPRRRRLLLKVASFLMVGSASPPVLRWCSGVPRGNMETAGNKMFIMFILQPSTGQVEEKSNLMIVKMEFIMENSLKMGKPSLLKKFVHIHNYIYKYLAKHGIQILQQPPYSPDQAPNDFFLFPKLKMALKGRRFDTRESIIADSKKFLKKIPKDAFSKCFKSWEKRWKLCIDAGKDYFEKY